MWNKLLKKGYPVFLDGASGTFMQDKGMPKGCCPEKWALEHKDVLHALHQSYVDVGSDIIYAFSFGANPIKLRDYDLEGQTYEINKELAAIAKEVAGEKVLVAGDLSPTGQYCYPMGDLVFEDLVDCYKAQVKGLLDGGVDLFILETMMDLQEARAALLAVKECCDLPVMASVTFEPNGFTLTGASPSSVILTLQSMGADVVGCNCSTGPEHMGSIISEMARYAKIPLLAKPNAGLPKLINGETTFDLSKEDFVTQCKGLLEAGATFIGGCCGTTPEFIQHLKETYKETPLAKVAPLKGSFLCSSSQVVALGQKEPLVIVGERINPTGKKKLQQSFKENNTQLAVDMAREQLNKGAKVLDVNVGMAGINEKEIMAKVIEALSVTRAPLCIDSSKKDVIESALRVYSGRALLNSISNEPHKRDELLNLAKKYGAMVLVLPMGEKGLPKDLDEKMSHVKAIIDAGFERGLSLEDFVVDGLVMTVSSKPGEVFSTLELIDYCSHDLGVNTILGLSNISFGLPARGYINSTFLAMAVGRGLTMAIANPNSDWLMHMKRASDVLMGRDSGCETYIDFYGEGQEVKRENPNQNSEDEKKELYDCVLKGRHKDIEGYINTALKSYKPQVIVNDILIPAINEVGELFEKQIYYLPQLIMSAQAMKLGFEVLEPLLAEEKTYVENQKVIVLATVQGDIHDIGKNIVALMFKNHGFRVIDLGKDVKVETIVDAVKEHDPHILGLSALMTTTMIVMKDVIKALKEEELNVKVMVGGAVVTQGYADEIGADAYSKDANEAVKVAKSLLGE